MRESGIRVAAESELDLGFCAIDKLGPQEAKAKHGVNFRRIVAAGNHCLQFSFGGNGIAYPPAQNTPLDLGNILPTGLDGSFLLSDLSVYFNYDGSGATDPNSVPADLIAPVAAVPFPSTIPASIGLVGIVGVVHLVRRRHAEVI